MNPSAVFIVIIGLLLMRSKRKSDLQGAGLDCPRATQDIALNTKNRNLCIRDYMYGPLNLSDTAYWVKLAGMWNTTPQVAMNSRCYNCSAFDISPRMLKCMPGPLSEPVGDAEGYLGYCWMHHFKCHSARTCETWAAGGPITDDKVSYAWHEKAKGV
jgi:hypothetical protein